MTVSVILATSFLSSSKCILWSSYSIIDRTMRVKIKNNSNTVDLWVIRILLLCVFRTKFIKNPLWRLKKEEKKLVCLDFILHPGCPVAKRHRILYVSVHHPLRLHLHVQTVSRGGSFSQEILSANSAKLSGLTLGISYCSVESAAS